MKQKKLDLDEKVKVIEYASKNPKLKCLVIAAQLNTGKTSASHILNNAKTLQKEYEFFKSSCWDMASIIW